jgi:hypothetical protein
MLKCESCGQEVRPEKAWKKVTGWMKPTGTSIHFQTPPFSYACETCMFEKKMEKELRNESLF